MHEHGSHDVLAAHTDLPMGQCLIHWEHGLKPKMQAECKLDPVTDTSYKDAAKARSAAIAVDIHSSAAAGKKRSSSSGDLFLPATAET